MAPQDQHPTPLPSGEDLTAYQAVIRASVRLGSIEQSLFAEVPRKSIAGIYRGTLLMTSRGCGRYHANRGSLRLPPELRNYIYDYILAGNTYSVAKDEFRVWDKGLWSVQDQNQFAFLRVCHDGHEEIASLPVTRNAFYFTHQPLGTRFWKRLSIRQKEQIQHVSVCFDHESCPGSRFVNRPPNTTKREGVVADFDFIRVLSGLNNVQVSGCQEMVHLARWFMTSRP